MTPIKVKTITDAHRLMGIAAPAHPLVSIVRYNQITNPDNQAGSLGVMFDFYFISLKKGFCNKLHYGQQTYDFDEGLLYFMAPHQLLKGGGASAQDDLTGWILMIHPDLLWGSALGKNIGKYDYFGYAVNEALFLSDKEEIIVNGIIQNIQTEYESNIDRFSQHIIVSHIETLLNYAERFYGRQFLTRKKNSHQVLDRLESLLKNYLNDEQLLSQGLPTVQYISGALNISPSYLRGLLKTLTGLSTQQYIHEKLIEKAKQTLSTTDLSISEIAYQLGFEHPQSFSKLFKSKTSQSPQEFRAGFN